MSNPVFLDSSAIGRMPNGSLNEWASFFNPDSIELESNGCYPLLWLALFRVSSIRWAKRIDDEDLSSPDRDEFFEMFGDEEYPYLVNSVEDALKALAERKAVLIDRLGVACSPIYDAFQVLIRQHYGPFVLLRTFSEPDYSLNMSKLMSDLDVVCAGGPVPDKNAIIADIASFHSWPTNKIYGLTGYHSGSIWPPADLSLQFPDPNRRQPGSSPATKFYKTKEKSNLLIEWGIPIIGGIAGLLGLIYTGSYWAVAAAAVVSMGVHWMAL